MSKKLISLLAILFFVGCASAPRSNQAVAKPKSFVPPWEYFTNLRPAVQYDEDKPEIKKAEYQTIGAETKEDHTQAIVIGTLVGIVTIGGAVGGILLAR